MGKLRNLYIIQINARSLKTVDYNKNKLVQFKTLMAIKKPHIASICETWLTKKIKDKDILAKTEYRIYRENRDIKRGGGVLVAVDKKLRSRRCKDLESKSKTHNEMIIVEVKTTNRQATRNYIRV